MKPVGAASWEGSTLIALNIPCAIIRIWINTIGELRAVDVCAWRRRSDSRCGLGSGSWTTCWSMSRRSSRSRTSRCASWRRYHIATESCIDSFQKWVFTFATALPIEVIEIKCPDHTATEIFALRVCHLQKSCSARPMLSDKSIRGTGGAYLDFQTGDIIVTNPKIIVIHVWHLLFFDVATLRSCFIHVADLKS